MSHGIVWLLATTLLLNCTPLFAVDIQSQLTALEELRLKDRSRFSSDVKKLKPYLELEALPKNQKSHLALLYSWDLVLSGEFSQAKAILEQHESTQDKHLSLRMLGLRVNIDILSFQYINAFISIEQLLVNLPNITDELAYYQLTGQIILLYNNIDRFDLAQHLVERGLSIASDKSIRCRLKALGLQSSYKTQTFQSYIQDFDETSSLCKDTAETLFYLLATRNHMFYLLEQQQAAAALAFYQQYYSQVEQINYPILTAGFNAAAAEALLQQGELAAASELAQRAEQSLPGDRNDPAVLSTYRVLTLLAQAERNFDNLLRYSEKRRDTELAIAREKASQQLAYQLASGEARLKEQRIQLLDKDNELLTLERNLYQQQAENRYLMLLLIGSLSLILGLLTYRGLTRSKRYRKMAEFDQLTGISNRYHFTEQAQREIAHCIRAQRPVALILFDLDHFKQINDRFGHAAGDWTLQQVVLSCRNFIRHSDIFGRIGGEEFVILLTDCTAEQAVMLADICRTALADIDTSGYQPKFKVTASFGISDSEQAGYDLSALLAAADAAMYQAKQQGRNQVYCPATADGAV